MGTWADYSLAAQTKPDTLVGDMKNWNGPLDLAVGGLVSGETWQAAAAGANDARWRKSLTFIRDNRVGKGTTYIRFAHESNGNWYPWKVSAGDQNNFKAAWARYRSLQLQILPQAKLVFNLNRESVNGIDWRSTFPGARNIDLIGVDYYNQYPWVGDQYSFNQHLSDTDGFGAPKGLAAYLAFAKSVGRPLSINEWASNAYGGDSADYIKAFHDYVKANAGNGAGQIPYEIFFNIDKENRTWEIYPQTRQPNAANAYRSLF
jgi:hypothetical protein